jgi:GLPGLI family protein
MLNKFKTINMKKLFALSAIILISMMVMPMSFASAPKGFEGIITYKITYPGASFPKEQMAMLPTTLTVSVKGTKARTEISTGMGNQIEITDYSNKSKISLLDLMGQKYAIKQTNEEIQKENADQPKGKVEVTSETKNIAGYNCKKAIVTTDDDGVKTTFEVFFTDELGAINPNFDNPTYKDINGVMMEFTTKMEQFSMKFTATSVEKKSISDKDFEIPAGYTLTTQEELKSKFGGMGGDE